MASAKRVFFFYSTRVLLLPIYNEREGARDCLNDWTEGDGVRVREKNWNKWANFFLEAWGSTDNPWFFVFQASSASNFKSCSGPRRRCVPIYLSTAVLLRRNGNGTENLGGWASCKLDVRGCRAGLMILLTWAKPVTNSHSKHLFYIIYKMEWE